MKELAEICGAWTRIRQEGQGALLATVVGVSGSTYRRPGARMLLTNEAGRVAGSVSGGCLEGDILKRAWWRTQDGPALVTYDSTDEDDIVWGFGLGCNGIVQVLMERVSPTQPGPFDLLGAVLALRRPGAIGTVIRSDSPTANIGERILLPPDGTSESRFGDAALARHVQQDLTEALRDGASRTETYPQALGHVTVFLEVVQPPLPLVIFGAGHDALPLVRIAKELGWHVTVVDTRTLQSRSERFPLADIVLACPSEDAPQHISFDSRTAAVVMTHNYPEDRRVLQMLLASSIGYLGQLGPRTRTERLLSEIAEDGFPVAETHQGRLHSPIGLDIGADNPEEIALAIVAEIQATFAGRSGISLSGRSEPLHSRKPTPCLLSASSF
jgi:xanthine dehydrogenase accessory factor